MLEYRKLLRGVVLAGVGLSLTACQGIREAAGITKEPPDEFAVVTKAPLIIPPDFNLHPPKPGAAPTNQVSPTQSAQAALYADDTASVAATISGNYSQAEKMLLASTGGAAADDSIRRTIAADNANSEDTDPSLTDSLLFGSSTPVGDQPVNADAEKSRIDAGKTGDQKPAGPPKDTATIDKQSSSGSWWPF